MTTSEPIVATSSSPVHVGVPAGALATFRQIDGGTPVHVQIAAQRDPRARLSAGHSRFQGFHLAPGHLLVSTPPPYRPLALVDRTTGPATIDLLDPGCDPCRAASRAFIAARELPRTLDHDPVNVWLDTTWDEHGFARHTSSAAVDDEVSLLAIEDLLVIVTPCAQGDAWAPKNRRTDAQAQVAVLVDDADATRRRGDVERIAAPFDALVTTAWPAANSAADTQPMIARDPAYAPSYQGAPLERHEIALTMAPSTIEALRRATGITEAPDASVVRFAVMDRLSDLLRATPLLRRGAPPPTS